MKSSDVANAGALRPPVIFMLLIIAGIGLDQIWFLKVNIGIATKIVGTCCVIVGVLAFALVKREFKLATTPIAGNKPTTEIIDTGIFKISRNPIYLSFSSMHLALAF